MALSTTYLVCILIYHLTFLDYNRGKLTNIVLYFESLNRPKHHNSHYYIQNVKDGIQIRVYKRNKESATHFSQFVSAKFKTLLRKSQTLFREKLRKLRLKQNDGFPIEKTCTNITQLDCLSSK